MEQCDKCVNCSNCKVLQTLNKTRECKNLVPVNSIKLKIGEVADINKNRFLGGLFGAAIGDAVGVPVEFKPRHIRDTDPVVSMRGHGSHGVAIGTWSDDTSMTLCLVDALTKDNVLEVLANNFVDWYKKDYKFKSTRQLFDIGGTTYEALHNIMLGKTYTECGSFDVNSNGNGSLMRILPLAFLPGEVKDKFKFIEAVSSVTHGHLYSRFSCVFYVVFCNFLYTKNLDKAEAYRATLEYIHIYAPQYYSEKEWKCIQEEFEDIINVNTEKSILNVIGYCDKEYISGSGYCKDTLKAAIWSFLTTHDYRSCVLTAVNLGDDTDTVGCVAGGIAGIYYSYNGLPDRWLELLECNEDLYTFYNSYWNRLKEEY